jgi:hypothetical protein
MKILAIVFCTLSVVFFLAIAYLAVFVKDMSTSSGGILFISAAFCALIGNLDKIESFQASISGFNAKMREADRVVDEAKSVLTELHKFAEMASTMLINMLSGEGRLGGRVPNEIEEDRKRILESLKSIGLDDEVIKKVSIADRQWVACDYSIGIMRVLKKSAICSPEQRQVGANILELWNSEDYRPTPNDFLETIKQHGITDPEVLELVRDYKYYMENGEHRRPSVWMNRRTW